MSCDLCRKYGAARSSVEIVGSTEICVSVDASRCAFDGAEFSDDNWNCQTINKLRDSIAETHWSEDQTLGVIAHDGQFLILGWYKSRGRVEVARVIREYECVPLTLSLALEFVVAVSQ